MRFLIKALYNHYISQRPDQIKASELTFVGMDENGKKYYSWDELDKVPKCRVDELQNLAIMDEMKLTKDQVFALCLAIVQNNESSLTEKNPKKAVMLRSQIDALAHEIMWRAENLTPTDLITEMAAVVCVREDEIPDKFTVRIQSEKNQTVQARKRERQFFFYRVQGVQQLETLIGYVRRGVQEALEFIDSARPPQRQAFSDYIAREVVRKRKQSDDEMITVVAGSFEINSKPIKEWLILLKTFCKKHKNHGN